MADEKATNDAPKKKLPIKTIIVVLGLLIAEGAVVVALMSMLGKPGAVQAGQSAELVVDDSNALNEVLIVEDRFPNHQTGRVWLWETEIQVQVKTKHLAYVEQALEERRAEIKTGISTIFRNAHQRHLTEPNLETLSRQVTSYLNEIFGHDSESEPRITRVLLPKCVGFPADF
ncbi:MAG: hypothetical protein ACYTF7_07095 [Planctomycetota bacterium]|jgi:flagellar basal body-associated protein FliL